MHINEEKSGNEWKRIWKEKIKARDNLKTKEKERKNKRQGRQQ